MVAKTPTKQKKASAPLDPARLRETLMNVDECVARPQELQFTVAGGRKVVCGVSLSPRSTRTSLRCKQESIRLKSNPLSRSPKVKSSTAESGGEWRSTSLPAMLAGETMVEILQASKFTRAVVAEVDGKSGKRIRDDPRSPITPPYKSLRPVSESSDLRTPRKLEKLNRFRSLEPRSPAIQRARTRINFKISPPKQRDCDKRSARYSANRVSPRNKPWAKKTVLFPIPLFTSTSPSAKHPTIFSKTKSPVIMRKGPEIPHKFLIKSPCPPSKFQVKIKSPPKVCLSLTRNSDSPANQRARSRINFKVSPPKQRDCDKGSARDSANRVSPRNKPWAKKTVLFPIPLFTSTSPSAKHPTIFSKTKSPVIMRKRPEIPHKFLIKSPCPPPPKFQVKIKSPPKVCLSLTRNSGSPTIQRAQSRNHL